MYIRYIHKLCDMHLQADNYTGTPRTHACTHARDGNYMCSCLRCGSTEAAFTLLLYWELLQWDERQTKELLHYPAQSEWQRKEALGRKLVHYFGKGKVMLIHSFG